MYHNLFVFLIWNIFFLYNDAIAIHCVPPEWFFCNNTRCVSSQFQCDGENDCGDESDELNCSGYEVVSVNIRCATDEFQCSDHACIPMEKFCDAKPDCVDRSDEYDGCVIDLKCDTFHCDDGYCVRNEWVCDGVPDCPDGSDEQKCENRMIPIEKCNNEYDRYLCTNQRCIFLNATCNEKNDCGDHSDEDFNECKKADKSCIGKVSCEHNCRKTPRGAQCSCHPGFKLINNKTCSDINECDEYGTCDQQCINTHGSYICSCEAGYSLSDDKRTCKAEGGEALMVFSIKSEIHGYFLNSQVYYPVTRNLQHAAAVSLDANYVYWSDIQDGDEAIMKSLVDGSQREVIVTTGLNSPDDIAVDWVTGNIYFTDSGYMHIGVCDNNGTYCTIVIKEHSDKPRGITLLPRNGIMYWTKWGINAGILMAGMDGKNCIMLIDENLEWPNSLSIDYANNRLYWIDSKLRVIESTRLDGTNRRTILKGIAKRPFSLAVFENKLYWSDWTSNNIQSCDKFTGKDWKILVHANSTIYGIHIYHSTLKPMIPNPCNANPCSQLCLLNSQKNYTCACTVDKELNSDQHTCRAIKKKLHLIIAAGNTFVDYYHELLGKPKITANVVLKHVTAVAYNPLTGGLLAGDQLTDNISHFNTRTGELKTMIFTADKIIGGIDFDYIGNNVYFTDVKHKSIEVYSLNSNERTAFYYQEEPYDIILIPEESTMIAVFHENGSYRIDMMNMNGLSSRITIEGHKTPLSGPKVSLSYDRDSKRLFWSDQGTGRICSTTIPGLQTYILHTGLSEPVSLAVLGDYVFWTQYKSNHLYWTEKGNTHQYQKRIALHTPIEVDEMQLVPLQEMFAKQHECRRNNGNCSHVCLLSNQRSHICGCPPDMTLTADNHTCTSQIPCEKGEIECSEHNLCIKLHQRCNGIRDCPNGEDETNICEELHWTRCKKRGDFQCKNGECINESKRCNSHYDCADRSDEEECNKRECDSNEFLCQEGACIPKHFVCNGQNDCSDFSDEINCGKHKCDNNSFVCDIGTCIPKTWRCDGEIDCIDGSDEDEKCETQKCSSNLFTCSNGRCIDSTLKCNGISECEDNSDEQYCQETDAHDYVNCSINEYKCLNTHICLPIRVRCDGVQDCPKNDDERNCVRCQKEEYACDNQRCIDKNWVCDSIDDCNDGSDERECDGGNLRMKTNNINSHCTDFKCSNGACLSFEQVCDGNADCMDGSDEHGDCAMSCTKNNPCTNFCHKTPTGPVCGCRTGYKLSSDLKLCKDINECERNICAQVCDNNDGSFVCSCHEGYVLRSDKVSCKATGPQMEIITVTGMDIRKISQNVRSIEIIHKEAISEISGLDVNTQDETIYWSNDILGMISKIHIRSKERKTVTGLDSPKALAVDWITNNVYFTNNEHSSTIRVCNLEEQKCAKVISIKPKNRAMAIVVDPIHGCLFWSQTSWTLYDRPTTDICRANTTGTNETAIVSRNIGIVYAIAIDYTRSRLYWTDTFFKVIESSDFDGSNRALFLNTDVHQALSINVHEDYLFWLVGNTGTIKRCKLYGEKLCKTISIGVSNVLNYFTIFHTVRQPFGVDLCRNHKCSYMCVSGSKKAACICHNGYPKDAKGSCVEITSTKMKFAASLALKKTQTVRQQSGALISIIVVLLVCVVIATAYFYYQKVKPSISKTNNISIHFQNPSYDHQSEIASSVTCISGLPPGEHEYVNPMVQIHKSVKEKVVERGGTERRVKKVLSFDQPEDEADFTYKQDVRLIQ